MKKKISCELCSSPATTYCESDQASLCWQCDAKVHKANFLVTKHSRNLLCHLCQNPTPWTASGPILPPSLSLCVLCTSTTSTSTTTSLHAAQSHQTDDEIAPHQPHHHHDTYDDDHDDDDDDTDEEEDEDEDSSYDVASDEEDDDNQVVPLTTISGSSSIGEPEHDEDDVDGRMSSSLLPSSLKRKREIYLLS